MGKYTKKILIIFLVLLVLGLACFMFILFGEEKTASRDVPETKTGIQTELEETQSTEATLTDATSAMPWDEAGAKQPVDYTWEEYDALTGVQQKAFKAHLGVEAYSKWLDSVRGTADVKPWDEAGAKQPEEYSWAEYEALSTAHQIAFQHYLGLDDFSTWMASVQREATPWDEAGSKQPADYTWEEFEALTAAHQMLFQYDLGTEGFDKWLNSVQNPTEAKPWEKSGAKQPEDYTMKEFERLTAAQQMAFQNVLGEDGFEKWMNQAQNQGEMNPWEKSGAKQPADYTLKEFERLTAAQQMAFQNALGADGFEEWINQAQNQKEINPWERSGAKQPEDYTWEEFEALTAAQQMAFQNYLGSEAFEAWLSRTGNV